MKWVKNINWKKREEDLKNLVNKFRGKYDYDCIVPYSGGKDSTFQAITARNLGLNPLLVSSNTCDITSYGLRNINNLKELGFDHIQFSPKKDVRAKLNKFGLEQVGDISWPEHVAMFTLPISVAVKFKIKLIFWGFFDDINW